MPKKTKSETDWNNFGKTNIIIEKCIGQDSVFFDCKINKTPCKTKKELSLQTTLSDNNKLKLFLKIQILILFNFWG